MLIIIVAICTLIFVFFFKRRPRLLLFGKFKKNKIVRLHPYAFYIEEVEFRNRQQSVHGYFNIAHKLQEIDSCGKLLETNYDFLDFFSVVLRFENCTMKLVRNINDIRLIKSEQPMFITDFEYAIRQITYAPI